MTLEVLLADDHAIIRDGLRNLLEDTPDLVVCGEAWDGTSTLEQVRRRDWALVVLDLAMPGRNGLELIKLIKAERPRLPILVFSMHQEEQYAVRAMRSGASGYLTKDSDSGLIVPAMRKVAAGGVFVSQKVAELLAVEALPGASVVAPHLRLSDREFEIFGRIVRGDSLTRIAEALNLSVKTVSSHKSHILEKMGLAGQVDLVRYAIEHHLIND